MPERSPALSRLAPPSGGARLVVAALVATGAWGWATGLGGCGGAASPALKGAPEPPLETVDDALRAFDEAEGEIAVALGGGDAQPYAQQPGQYPSPAPAPPPPPADEPIVSEEAEDAPTQAQEVSSSPCAVACRALASMERSAERLCELSGEDDERCARAQERLGRATEKVHASCSACEGEP